MHALAEFIMRGRLQAGAVVVFGYIIPLLTPATIALVTLRKGAYEGTIILLLGLLPVVLSLLIADSADSIIAWVTLLSLVVVYIPALVLRATVSLPATLVAMMLLAFAITAAIMVFAPAYIDGLLNSYKEMVSQLSLKGGEKEFVDGLISGSGVSGMIAFTLIIDSLTGLLLGRWLQSLVYNPAGFGAEFRALRVGLVPSVLCFVASLWLRYQGGEFWWWSNVFAIPLVMVAIAVAHSFVKDRNIAIPWLILFYFAVLLFMPLVMCIGLIDARMNFRDRWKNKQ